MEVKTSKLASFRALFRTDIVGGGGIEVYVLPRCDAHQSEYISARDQRVQFLSGFSGSNGFTIITESEALLWTDGRYFVQAEQELEEGWSLMKTGEPGVPVPMEWLALNLTSGTKVGFDPQLFSKNTADDLFKACKKARAQSVKVATNLVDVIWQNRPNSQSVNIIALKSEEHGEEICSKVSRVRQELKKRKCDMVVLSDLAQIAWLLNIRGFDIPYNPVFFSFAYVTLETVVLFVDLQKISSDVKQHLTNVDIEPYEDAAKWLNNYHDQGKRSTKGHRIWIPGDTNYALCSLVDPDFVYEAPSPVYLFKALKNPVELDGMRKSHIRDSAAIVQFLVWLRKQVEAGESVTEADAADKMGQFRAKLDNYVSLSFDTISAVDEHAALPHYHMTAESGKKTIVPNSVFLLDSGGQYRDGTTDVTRTVVHADPDPFVTKMFTLVLKGHIDCAKMTFPNDIDGIRLDTLARHNLWAHGYDFGHGTGHGVGHFLNVHEHPSQIGFRLRIPEAGVKKGMILTIEPGYYHAGKFGIRIENCYEVVRASALESGADNFLTFASLTWVPIQKSLIDVNLLDKSQVDWLNEYHNKCLELVGRYLQERGLQEEYNYLAEACTPL